MCDPCHVTDRQKPAKMKFSPVYALANPTSEVGDGDVLHLFANLEKNPKRQEPIESD